MLKYLSRILDRDNYIITKSPPEQYTNSEIKMKEKEEIKLLNEYGNAIIVFDENLGPSNRKYIDQFFIRRRRKNLDFHYLSQCFYD